MVAMPSMSDFNAVWSNANGGEVLVTVGSMRLRLSAAWAALIRDKFGAALAIPVRAEEMARRDPVPDLERVPDETPAIVEGLRERKGALCRQFPARGKRLEAVILAVAEAESSMAEVVSVGGILFTLIEATEIRRGLKIDGSA